MDFVCPGLPVSLTVVNYAVNLLIGSVLIGSEKSYRFTSIKNTPFKSGVFLYLLNCYLLPVLYRLLRNQEVKVGILGAQRRYQGSGVGAIVGWGRAVGLVVGR